MILKSLLLVVHLILFELQSSRTFFFPALHAAYKIVVVPFMETIFGKLYLLNYDQTFQTAIFIMSIRNFGWIRKPPEVSW
jgi:hypothetical protein